MINTEINSKFKPLLPFVLLIIFGCSKKYDEHIEIQSVKDSVIVLVNIGGSDRLELAKIIDRVSSCNPKIIGINYLLSDEAEFKTDSILASSIDNSGKVTLIESFEKNELKVPHPKFTNNFLGSSSEIYETDDDSVVIGFRPNIEVDGAVVTCFSYGLAFAHSPENGARFFLKSGINPIKITWYHNLNGFTVLQPEYILENNICEITRGKIILLGDLEPNSVNTLKTPISMNDKEDKGSHTTLIIANIILNILNKGAISSSGSPQ